MANYERTARIESVGLDGIFEMTLATEGEASDGHILSIKGGQIPERMPLLVSHWNDPFGALGSITDPVKHVKDSPPRLRAVGNIEMDGPMSEARRDLAHMINKGHVNAVSIRWDEVPGKSIRRVNLPSDHPYYVDAETEKSEARWGIFFEEWIGREGSIVALGADKGALIGRAEETDGEISSFWRAMANDAEPSDNGKLIPDMLAALRTDAAVCLSAGVSIADIINAVAADNEGDAAELVECTIGESKILLPTSIADQLEDERADRKPEPDQVPEAKADQPTPINWSLEGLEAPLDTETVARALTEALDKYDARVRKSVNSMVDMLTGKVAPNGR